MLLLELGQHGLWQWNTNQRIVIDDESVEVVSFSTNGVDAVRREVYRDGETRYADIPNKLLQTDGNLYVYAHRMDQERFTTMLESVFLIHGQPKPPDYIDNSPDEVLIWRDLEEQVWQNAAKAAASATKAKVSLLNAQKSEAESTAQAQEAAGHAGAAAESVKTATAQASAAEQHASAAKLSETNAAKAAEEAKKAAEALPTDKSLSVSDKAADAKVTGGKLEKASYDSARNSREIQGLKSKVYLKTPTINQYDWNRSDDVNFVPYMDKAQKYVVPAASINSVVVPVRGGEKVSVERIAGERFTITQMAVYPASRAPYLVTQDFHKKTKATVAVEADAKYLLITLRHTSDSFSIDDVKRSVKVYDGSEWVPEGDTKLDDLYKKVLALESKTYLEKIPAYAMSALAYKPLGVLSKGYICLSCDDGDNTLATYTIPMLKQKNVPCTFGLMSDSKVMGNPEYVSLVKDMVANHKCSVAQHGRDSFTSYSETQLVSFLDSEREKFKQQGIETEGAICPNHDYNDLVSAVAGGKYGIVCTGGTNKPVYYSRYTLGPRSNLYALYRTSVQSIPLEQLKAAIDLAYTNHYIYMPFWHDNAFASDPSQQQKLEAMIDYAKQKGIAFCTVGEIGKLL